MPVFSRKEEKIHVLILKKVSAVRGGAQDVYLTFFSLFSYWFEGTLLISPNFLDIDKNGLGFLMSRYSSLYSGSASTFWILILIHIEDISVLLFE